MHSEPDRTHPGCSSCSMLRLMFAKGPSRSPWTGRDGLRGILIRTMAGRGPPMRIAKGSAAHYVGRRSADAASQLRLNGTRRYQRNQRRSVHSLGEAPTQPRSATSAGMGRRSFDRPASRAPITANTCMCCGAENAGTNMVPTVLTSSCDGAWRMMVVHQGLSSDVWLWIVSSHDRRGGSAASSRILRTALWSS